MLVPRRGMLPWQTPEMRKWWNQEMSQGWGDVEERERSSLDCLEQMVRRNRDVDSPANEDSRGEEKQQRQQIALEDA